MSVTSVLIVALNSVLKARLVEGIKVATSVADAYVTCPATLAPPGPVTVNVDLLIVAGFIALLKVALTMVLLGQTATLPSAGVTDVTVGGVC